ncbi:MAG: PQQ-like beta-propeller repeat protein [Acidimicrobiia bacterium]|nr:PQQ-like beta-propeller repeat protein [Acidimicrobiia bacterium]
MMIRLLPLLLMALSQTVVPASPLAMRDFRLQFDPAGTFTLGGAGWPSMAGTWTLRGAEITLQNQAGPKDCLNAARYTISVDGARVGLDLIADDCQPRRMILDRSRWMPPGAEAAPSARSLVRTPGPAKGPLPPARTTGVPAEASAKTGDWPSFRGREASGIAEQQNLPDTWNPATGEHILWKTPIPGLAHSSPIVWGDTVFVTSAISGRGRATFKPGLYGDGDASEDRSPHRWMLYAIDKRTGRIRWERTAAQGEPRNKRHIKSTYASASPATDGRIVVTWFGSQGIDAYDLDGGLRWSVDIGRVDMGAYDIPAYEWGPASSPIIWNGLVIVQCDTQADSFLLALDAATGETVWKTDRTELPSWGTPTIVTTPAGPELITNASNFVRGYDPRTGQELWKLGGSSKITAPTPIFANGLHIIASGRAPERPVFAVKPGARGDLTLAKDATDSAHIAWSKTGRGSYMPTPLAYRGQLYVLANNGVFDAYDITTGKEIYRQRLQLVGSGYSASPVAADGKIYLSNEDGEMVVVEAGATFRQISANAMGEMLMATPALSDGVMYVRGVSTLFAIGRR